MRKKRKALLEKKNTGREVERDGGKGKEREKEKTSQ